MIVLKPCVFRHHALWEKYVDKVNKLEQEKNIISKFRKFELLE
jgi:hypothetical protein